jgi:hypothetical protein
MAYLTGVDAGNTLTDSGLQTICIALGSGKCPLLMTLKFGGNPAITCDPPSCNNK